MGIFRSIKRSLTSCHDIDEKIEYLNKELEKTGLREGMTTTNVYVGGKQIDNPIYNSFTSSVFNSRPLGHSPSDNSGGLGGAYTGKVIAGEHGLSVGAHDHILNLKSVANSPQHPVSGKRSYASTRTGMVDYSPTQPGVKQGNSDYPTGSVSWLWNPTTNNSDGTTGSWYPLEFDVSSGQWGFWDTSFLGFGFLNTNLSQLEFTSGDSTGSSVVSLFNTIGLTNRENIGTQKTIVLQKNDLGSAGFLPINVNLSSQGFDYLRGRAGRAQRRRSGGARKIRSMSGGPTYRKAGSGGVRRKNVTSMSGSQVPLRRGSGGKAGSGGVRRGVTSMSGGVTKLGKGGRVTGRGVMKTLGSRGVGFSPSAARVAQNVAKELPPKPTPAEIRKETVKQFRDKGENLAANKFYTEDRISELESKDKLTSSEQDELKQLKVYSVYIADADRTTTQPVAEQQADADKEINQQIKTNQNAFASAGYDPVTEFLSADGSDLSSSDVEILKSVYEGDDSKVSEWTKKSSDSSTGDDSKVTQLPPPVEEPPKPSATEISSKEKYTFPDGKTGQVWTQRNGDKIILNDKLEVVDELGMKTNERQRLNWLGKQKNNLGIAAAVVSGSILPHQPLPSEIEQVKTSLKPSDFTGENGITITSEEIPYSDGNFYVTYDKNGNKVFNDNRGDDGSQGAVQPDLSNPDIGGSTDASMLLYGKPNMQMVFPKDGSPPYLKMEKYAYHNLNSPESDELPDKGSEVASNIIHGAAETISAKVLRAIKNLILPDTKIPDFLSENGIKGMTHTEQKFAFDELPEDVQEQLKESPEYKAWLDSKTKADAIDKYPPPKQESIFTNEDGIPSKYYTRSIFTGKDGKTYKSVLYLPYTGDNDDGSPRFGSLYHPGSYNFNIPLFDTPMDEPLGDYTPPDDLPDIPFTPPEPEPEPDNRKDYEKNRDRQRRHRQRNSYEPEGNVLSEAAKLGHFEPEQLTVDIEKLRKGIMPEFPKDPPPKMVDGYSEKSKLAPKTIEGEPFINITKKDLAKNHMLKDSEIKKFMDDINLINKYIKENPSELAYAQIRYPKDDPRLAQLNWQMDQMLDASNEYMDKHYPENQKLFTKIQKSIKKNIELTDPKSFKGVKVPKFEGVDLSDFKRRKEVVARHYKKVVNVKKLFSRKKT